ncbi:MAG: hypothetical protein ACYTDY_14225, partial [Planctomycetota bacterium]
MKGTLLIAVATVLWVGAVLFAGWQIFLVGPDQSGGKADRTLAVGVFVLTTLLTVVVLIGLGALFFKLGVPVPYPGDCILRQIVGSRPAREIMEGGEFLPAED